MKKPDFDKIYFDADDIVWGQGNHIVGLPILASIKFGEPSKEMQEKEKKEYFEAKEIYDKYINLGQKFKPSGDNANKNVECKITFFHSEKQLITWKQYNLSNDFKEKGFKPASGKWLINSMITLVKNKQIEFID